MQFEVECDPMRYENKVETIEGIHTLNLKDKDNLKGVQKTSQKDHLLINVTCMECQVEGIK
jgi:hypothetical protein